jgi:hypothetical protein
MLTGDPAGRPEWRERYGSGEGEMRVKGMTNVMGEAYGTIIGDGNVWSFLFVKTFPPEMRGRATRRGKTTR